MNTVPVPKELGHPEKQVAGAQRSRRHLTPPGASSQIKEAAQVLQVAKCFRQGILQRGRGGPAGGARKEPGRAQTVCRKIMRAGERLGGA